MSDGDGARARALGSPDVEIEIGGVSLSLPHDGFFQVNMPGALLLYARIGEALGVGGTLLDLYCGNGVIGIVLARAFERVVGVDLHEPSIARARANADRNGVRGVWYAGAVEEILPTLAIERPLKVVVDPPRAGLHPKAVAHLAGLAADTLVYVACTRDRSAETVRCQAGVAHDRSLVGGPLSADAARRSDRPLHSLTAGAAGRSERAAVSFPTARSCPTGSDITARTRPNSVVMSDPVGHYGRARLSRSQPRVFLRAPWRDVCDFFGGQCW
jgi:16S rRNA G966 N2-methylase RsmD